MDFLIRAKEFIESNLDLYSNVALGLLLDGDSIAIRPTPSTPPLRYLEKSKVTTYQFQILTKHQVGYTAYQELEKINDLLDGLENGAITSSDSSFILNKCEVYTSPNFVEKTEGGEQIYTAIYQAELYIREE